MIINQGLAGGGGWIDVTSHFSYTDGTCDVEITALQNGTRIILMAVATSGLDGGGIDGLVYPDDGYGPASYFIEDDSFSMTVEASIEGYGYMQVDFAPYELNAGGFDLSLISSPIVPDEYYPVYCICAYEIY